MAPDEACPVDYIAGVAQNRVCAYCGQHGAGRARHWSGGTIRYRYEKPGISFNSSRFFLPALCDATPKHIVIVPIVLHAIRTKSP